MGCGLQQLQWELERAYSDRTVLLVSHGEVLQILQKAFDGIASGRHRLLPPLATGQIRRMVLKGLTADQ